LASTGSGNFGRSGSEDKWSRGLSPSRAFGGTWSSSVNGGRANGWTGACAKNVIGSMKSCFSTAAMPAVGATTKQDV
jgi:hypothetical protein